jgi:hypothetical protein
LSHTCTTGGLARQCVFAYRTSDEHDDASALRIRVEVSEDSEDAWMTRLELDA